MSSNSSLKLNWKNFLIYSKNKIELFVTVILLAAILIFFSQFLLFVEERAGVIFSDPILNLFSPIDLTWFTFTLIYLSLLIALIELIKNPEKLLLALQCYGLMVVFRAIAMYLLPLEAPSTLLLLNDPFVQLFGEGNILEKDLFFSGHTATLFLLFLVTTKRSLKIIFLIFTTLVAISVILQHVHYSIDVFAAPFFSYTSYRVILFFKEKETNNV
ncbi:MAG: sphingomyelin synthase family protein [Ignavibacteria bacterium]|nr:sphingomyelin synthase family protein [Ignavibacteria bacterium]MBT8383941.1 sphingomyelin synthase family protein [Ignavibacteria bacterium]MBT8392718.1 sphingomyelin synthase family protein [Ignavibacteria bacterium]NNJ52268.1 phosphatase PAP2 family protein [Ignavibacteriaceae bacterium]NNL21708.1 phosphatase PAP2 family protein [Ignavibacteriaceae bacterium]